MLPIIRNGSKQYLIDKQINHVSLIQLVMCSYFTFQISSLIFCLMIAASAVADNAYNTYHYANHPYVKYMGYHPHYVPTTPAPAPHHAPAPHPPMDHMMMDDMHHMDKDMMKEMEHPMEPMKPMEPHAMPHHHVNAYAMPHHTPYPAHPTPGPAYHHPQPYAPHVRLP